MAIDIVVVTGHRQVIDELIDDRIRNTLDGVRLLFVGLENVPAVLVDDLNLFCIEER